MAMDSAIFHCKTCKTIVAQWDTRCPHCGAARSIAIGKPGKSTLHWIGGGGKPMRLNDVSEEDYERLATGTRELDRTLGGGLVTGGAVLISGDPGIGKSTLLLQVSMDMTSAEIVDDETGKPIDPLTILYVSAEETGGQIKGRSSRLEGPLEENPTKARAQLEAQKKRRLFIFNENDVEEIEKQVLALDPDVLIVDSIQTMIRKSTDGQPGSVQQVRECAVFLTQLCKQRGISLILVAHINKDGVVAGPKTLEHLVDTVLEFSKEGSADLRSVRASKNRFGDTNEMGLFRMTRDGLRSVENPSELLLGGDRAPKPGTSIGLVSIAKSSRAYAMEFQTLMGPALDIASKSKTRSFVGLDSGRITQVMAVLSRRYGLDLLRDIFVNCPGDHEDIKDPALDLPLALCLASAALNIALPESLIAFGEVGLAGEIRPATFMEARVKTAALMGFKMILGPPLQPFEADMLLAAAKEAAGMDSQGGQAERYYGVATLEDAFDLLQGLDVIVPVQAQVSTIKEERKGKVLQLVPKKPKKDP
jgi:DNA repair protein RadA/Sms